MLSITGKTSKDCRKLFVSERGEEGRCSKISLGLISLPYLLLSMAGCHTSESRRQWRLRGSPVFWHICRMCELEELTGSADLSLADCRASELCSEAEPGSRQEMYRVSPNRIARETE